MNAKCTIVVSLSFTLMVAASTGLTQRIETPLAAYWLQYACSRDSNDSASGYCQGAIEASYSVMEGWCVPAEVTQSEIKAVVVEALLSQSFSPLDPAAEFIWGAIDAEWPCD